MCIAYDYVTRAQHRLGLYSDVFSILICPYLQSDRVRLPWSRQKQNNAKCKLVWFSGAVFGPFITSHSISSENISLPHWSDKCIHVACESNKAIGMEMPETDVDVKTEPVRDTTTVSYTHLTLPTIYSV